jgi:hypothetical protein
MLIFLESPAWEKGVVGAMLISREVQDHSPEERERYSTDKKNNCGFAFEEGGGCWGKR